MYYLLRTNVENVWVLLPLSPGLESDIQAFRECAEVVEVMFHRDYGARLVRPHEDMPPLSALVAGDPPVMDELDAESLRVHLTGGKAFVTAWLGGVYIKSDEIDI